MKDTMIKFIFSALLVCGMAAVAQQVSAPAIEKTPAEKMMEQALAERSSGALREASQTVARALTLESVQPETMAACELLMAELYLEQGMTHAAEVTARQVAVLYSGTDFEKDAETLRAKIKTLKQEASE